MKRSNKGLSLIFFIWVILVQFLTTKPVYSQFEGLETKKESIQRLEKQLEQAKTDRTRAALHRELYYIFINDDTDKALEVAQQAVKFAQLAGAQDLIVYSYSDLGTAYLKKGDFNEASENFALALQNSESSPIKSQSTYIQFDLGIMYTELLLFETAKIFLHQAESEFINTRNKSLATYELAKIYLMEGDTSQARIYTERLKNYIPENGSHINYDYLFHYAVLSELYANLNELDKAEEILTSALPAIEYHNRRFYRGIASYSRSLIEYNRNNFRASLSAAQQALTFFRDQKEASYMAKTYDQLSKTYQSLGRYEEALSALEEYNNLSNARFELRQSALEERLVNQHEEVRNAEGELEKTESTLKQRQIFLTVLSIMFALLLILTIMLYRSSKAVKTAAKKLDQLNKEKNHFIGVVSHDLRSPLNSIMLLSSLMVEDRNSIDPDKLRDYNSIILNSSRRMEYLVNNMLDASKIEAGKTDLLLEPLQLSDIVRNVYNSIIILGNDKNITTQVDIEPDLPPIIGDQHAISRILENLISNAYKFSPKQTTVSISAKVSGEQVELSVKDQGPGISDLDKDKLFRKFEKLSANPTANEKSTGLGLFIVKNLVQQMDGTILIETMVDKGTTFKVLFNKA